LLNTCAPFADENSQFDCIVIGAGAAGLMCAAVAADRGRRVLVLERAKQPGRKILMSGGGRCNFTNRSVEPAQFVSENSHFCISALRRYGPEAFLDLVQSYDLAFHEKKLGQLFCDRKARDILNILVAECDQAGAQVRLNCHVQQVGKTQCEEGSGDQPSEKCDQTQSMRFFLNTNQGRLEARALVVATGGLSIPSMGATDFGYQVAEQFGLRVTERQPSLVPLTLPRKLQALAAGISGVSLPVAVSCGHQRFTEDLLFTHTGLSGPAILQISNYWHYGDSVSIDFLPDHCLELLFDQWQQAGEKATLKNLLARLLPRRFVTDWVMRMPGLAALLDCTIHDLAQTQRGQIIEALKKWSCVPAGTAGYQVAEVTRGGVDTAMLSSKTFESKTVPGLYFVGEVLDVTGWLGGYNFQWAWASGYCAGQAV
jgi:predicted Rossmann fold flavoprotein